MNTERIIVLENTGDQPVVLKDTQGRIYRLGTNGKIRISQVSLQDIFDYAPSKIIFEENLVKVGNVSADILYNMGLSEDEINKFMLETVAEAPKKVEPTIDAEAFKEPEATEEEPEAAEEEPVVEEKKPVAKKPAAKKASKK